MCGVYGSFSKKKFIDLGLINAERGNFSCGVFRYNGISGTYNVHKAEGVFVWDKVRLQEDDSNELFYLGHNQAPTSNERDWSYDTTHPFRSGDWFVAHNGVLTNFNKLVKEYLPKHENKVDTSIIPALLATFGVIDDENNEHEILRNVISLLNGTFALWLVNTRTMNVYLARQGSTLFYDEDSFSSIQQNDMISAEDGKIYQFTKEGVIPVANFKNRSPFLNI
jgi:glucosamine 6-phosphate synthetase-like amidotransferase/phosphosugar isomerase protein